MKKNIKDLRLKNGFTQKEFANYIGIPYRTFQNYEEGISSMPEWIYNLIEYKLNNENNYSLSTGIYKIKQLKLIIKPIAKKYKILSIIIFGEYANKQANEFSYINLMVKFSKNKDEDISLFKNELEDNLKKTVRVFNQSDFDNKGDYFKKIKKEGVNIYKRY